MKVDYSKLFTLRSDGRYQGYWHELVDGKPVGPRHTICDRDPQKLFLRIKEKETARVRTFGELADEWQESHVSKLNRGTQQTYRAPLNRLIQELGNRPITDVSSVDISQILQSEKKLGKSYKHAALLRSIFKQICDYAIGEKELLVNPALSVKVPAGMRKGKVDAPDEKTEAIIKANLDKPFGEFVALLLYTGMRTEEAAALRWEDVDFKTDRIKIDKAMDLHGTPKLKETKTESGTRIVPILPPLKKYFQKPKGAKGYVFHVDGRPMTRAQVSSRWLGWCKAAGLAEQKKYWNRHRGERLCARTEWRPTLTPHQLRHYFATVLFENNVDPLTTQKLMGDKDIETTQKIYTSLREKHLEDKFEVLKKIFT